MMAEFRRTDHGVFFHLSLIYDVVYARAANSPQKPEPGGYQQSERNDPMRTIILGAVVVAFLPLTAMAQQSNTDQPQNNQNMQGQKQKQTSPSMTAPQGDQPQQQPQQQSAPPAGSTGSDQQNSTTCHLVWYRTNANQAPPGQLPDIRVLGTVDGPIPFSSTGNCRGMIIEIR
jgi:hypothetical protein